MVVVKLGLSEGEVWSEVALSVSFLYLSPEEG
jgi:hypothetical protein